MTELQVENISSLVYYLPLNKGHTVTFTPNDYVKSMVAVKHLEQMQMEEEEVMNKDTIQSQNISGSGLRGIFSQEYESDGEDEDFVVEDDEEDEDLENSGLVEDSDENETEEAAPNRTPSGKNSNVTQVAKKDLEILFSRQLDTPEVERKYRSAMSKNKIPPGLAPLGTQEKDTTKNSSKFASIFQKIEWREQELKSKLVRGVNEP